MAGPSILFLLFALLSTAGAYGMTVVLLEGPGRHRWAARVAVAILFFFIALYAALYRWIWPLLTEP